MNQILENIYASTAYIIPEIILSAGLVALILIVSFSKKEFNHLALYIALSLFGLLALQIISQDFFASKIAAFHGLIIKDALGNYAKILILLSATIALLHSRLLKYKIPGEMPILLAGAVFGMFFMVMSSHFVSMMLSLEVVSLCSYMLIALDKKKLNLEAGIKYLLFGATASAIMFYGISLIYGMSGSLNFSLPAVAEGLKNQLSVVYFTAILMTLAGLFFKINAVPFHTWSPDVYEAGATPIVSFLGVAPKAAAIIVIIRLQQYLSVDFTLPLALIVLASISIGNLAALWQNNLKRMLGYSGIAHAGFLMIGLLAGNQNGYQASIFYISIYLFINMAAFLAADIFYKLTNSHQISDLAGLGSQLKTAGITVVIIMVALIGLPPTAGFTGKFMVFIAAWDTYSQTGQNILAAVVIFGLMNTAISIYYYFKVPYFLFLKKAENKTSKIAIGLPISILLLTLNLSILLFFFFPNLIQQVLTRLF